ncbi:MAG: PKD domain-containing protein [Bacteroidia bacterium]
MKKITCLLLALMSIMFSTAFGAELTGIAAHHMVPGAEKIKTGTSSNIPEYIKFRAGSEPAYNQFATFMKLNFRMPEDNGFKLLSTETDRLGFSHYRYQQTVNGIPVEGTMYIVHVKNNNIVSLNGLLFDKMNAAVNASLDKESALSKALQYTNATLYRWQVPGWEAQIKQTSGNQTATWYPQGELVYAPLNGNYKAAEYRLCYKFDIYAEQPLSRKYVFVDAITGAVILTTNRIHTTNTTATVVTAYSGIHTITTDSVNPTTFRLRETGRGLGIETYNSQNTTNHPSTDFTDSDNNWNNVNAQLDQYAGDAHWGAEMTYDFYFIKFNRNSIDNAGQKLLSYVHYDQNLVNANWDGTHMNYGDGDGSPYTPLTSLDVAGHEISHGVTEHTSNLIYSDESGGLNEAFSDCMGNAIRYYGKQPATIDWLIGDEIGGTPFRNMANPKQYQNPDCYGGQYWYAPNEVHNNSGVMNYWFYLLTEGGSGTNDVGSAYNVTGLGIDTAAQICYRMNAVYLIPSSDYADARYYAIQAATDLYGPCTPEVIATVDAWYAVGVGAAFVPGVSSDFSTPVTSFCQAPASVAFSNLSNNAGSYFWDFGDGTTSTLMNPVHVYANYGDYTVKLVSDGGTCGIDSITKTTYISVNVANPCIVNLPVNGTASTQTTCAGQLFDDGGPSANYADNSTSYITIAPIGAATVELTFSLFDLEDTYDFLYIYDGASTNSTLLGSYTGNSGPGVITSTGGALTLKFTSDQFVNNAGFALAWLCQLSTVAPVANFTADVTTSCSGIINFTDLSTFGPTSWLWDFGDGSTSTLQSPSHVYQSNGTFTVMLTATNSIGSNTATQTAYITINLPTAPTAAGTTICAGNPAVLTATGIDSLTWFNAPVGGTPLYSGGTFTTPAIFGPTTYYVESDIYPAPQNNGPVDNTFGTGGFFTNNNYHDLIFDCFTPVKLVSVKVYAQGAGIRTITLMDNTGATLQSLAVNIPDGMSIVTLNFDLPVGTDLELGTAVNVDLYRNQGGATFPYTLAGVVSIKGTNAGNAGFYYYFYDWVIQSAPCTSARTPVSVAVLPSPISWFTFSYLTNVVVFGDLTSGGPTSWFWDFGDGTTSTLQNPIHTYATTGTYTVTLTTTLGTCSNTATRVIIINIVGINEQTASDLFSMYPNPAKNEVVIKLSNSLQKSDCIIKLTNSLGQTVIEKNCTGQLASYTFDVSQLPPGIYTVEIQSADKKYYQKLTKQ